MHRESKRTYHYFGYLIVVSLFSGFLINGCATTSKSTTTTSEKYTEDLTVFRPPVINEIPPEISSGEDSIVNLEDTIIAGDITYKLDSLLDSVSVNNQNKKFIQGYTIQVYTGNNRKLANDIKTQVYSILYGSRPTLSYDLPNYKVKVGKYYHRLEAQRDFESIKKVYRNAILVPQRFRID